MFALRNVRVLDLVESDDDVSGGRLWALYEALLNTCFSSSSRVGVTISRLGEALSEAVSASASRNSHELIVFARMVTSVIRHGCARALKNEDMGFVLDAANTILVKAYALLPNTTSGAAAEEKDSQAGLEAFKILSEPISALARAGAAKADGDGTSLIQLLKHIELGLEAWFADEAGVVEDGAYNSPVRFLLSPPLRYV